MILTCQWCGEKFQRPNHRGPPPKFCRPSHRQRAHEHRRQLMPSALLLEQAVARAAKLHDQHIEQRYHDTIDELANIYGVDHDTVEQIWDEVAP